MWWVSDLYSAPYLGLQNLYSRVRFPPAPPTFHPRRQHHAALGMSRSNNYQPVGIWHQVSREDGRREWRNRFPERLILSRRTWRRRQRYRYGIKAVLRPPAKSWWKAQRKRARAIQRREMRLNPEDSLVTPMKRLINLWDWY